MFRWEKDVQKNPQGEQKDAAEKSERVFIWKVIKMITMNYKNDNYQFFCIPLAPSGAHNLL